MPFVGSFLQQAIGEIPFVISFVRSFSAASYWGCPSSGLSFVPLLGKEPAGSSFAASWWGNAIRRVLFLQQAIGEIPFVISFVRSFSAASYWGCPSSGLSFVPLLGKEPAGSSFAASWWGNAIRRVLFLQQAIGEIPFVISFVRSFSAASYWGCPSSGLSFVPLLGKEPAGSSFAASWWGNAIRRVLFLQQAIGEIPHLWALFLQQPIGDVLVLGFLLFRTTCRVFFCSKLLGNFHS